MSGKLRAILLQLVVWATVGVCVFEAFSKGWASLWLVPVAAATLPEFVILEYVATFSSKDEYRRTITALQVVLAASLLAYFVAAVGFLDDPSTVYVLGLLWVPTDSLLAQGLDTVVNDTPISAVRCCKNRPLR